MAFTVYFYEFNKKENSTLQPNVAPSSYNCIIKRGSGLINPKLELDIGLSTAPSWNYCYIPNFGRYYFVTEWYNDKALWIAELSIDVLATYRTEIGSANLYALRSSASYDGRIIDTFYPTKVNSVFRKSLVVNPWDYPSDGCFIIGVVSKKPNYGSLEYFVVSNSAMRKIVEELLDNTITEGNGFLFDGEATQPLQLALLDPLQYIKSAMFFPISAGDIPGIGIPTPTIKIFNYDVNVGSGLIGAVKILEGVTTSYVPEVVITENFTIPKHPQQASRGNFVNTAPFTNLTLLFPPFGIIDIDTSVTCDSTTLIVEIRVDCITGAAILETKVDKGTEGGVQVLNRLSAQVGVPIQLSQVNRDYLGAFNNIMSAGSSIANAVGSGMSTAPSGKAGAVAGGFQAAGAIGNAIGSLMPRSQSVGSSGGYSQLYETPYLMGQFFELVDDDIVHNGRPLCQLVTCSSNTGYYLIQDGDVAISGTREEAQQIKNYLESGFYWE